MYGFMLHTHLLSQQIPNSTLYTWMVINHIDGTVNVMERITNAERRFYTTFTRADIYEIMVQARNIQSQTLLFNATTTIIIIES